MIRLTCILVSILTVIMLIVAVNVTNDAKEVAGTASVERTLVRTEKPESMPIPKRGPSPTIKPTPKPTTKPTPKPEKTASMSDLDLLARLVYAEAGSNWCSDEMQLLVANVVINRIHDKRFPNTLRGVIYQRGQYACVGKLGRVKPNARAIKNAKHVLEGERFCPAKVVFQSEFRQGKHLWKHVGNQYFCY